MAATTTYAPPIPGQGNSTVAEDGKRYASVVDIDELDKLHHQTTTVVDGQGMRIDREMFRKFKEEAQGDETLAVLDDTDREAALQYFKDEILDKPNHFMNLDKIRSYFKLDRKLSLGEALDITMDRVETPKPKAQVISEKFTEAIASRGLTDALAEDSDLYHLAYRLFDSYISSPGVQAAIDSREYARLNDTNQLTLEQYITLHEAGVAEPLVTYISDYIDSTKLRG